jgi:tRNA(fMet)-specific endonuclease VapC
MYLLDTDTVIYALNGVPSVVRAMDERRRDAKAISVITYGELVYGATKSARPVENLAKVRRFAELIAVVDVSRAIMETFGALKSKLGTAGKSLDDFDVVIAATALVLNYRLVTNNERHFVRIRGLTLENWRD